MPTLKAIPTTASISNTAVSTLSKHVNELGLVKQLAQFKQTKYSDSMLSELLIAAKKIPSTEKAATDMQSQLIRVWLDKLEPPENVFKFLMLDKAADNLLSDPQFLVWRKYATAFNDLSSGKPQMSLIGVLMKNYDDKAMAKIIIKGKEISGTEIKANYVERELLLRWAIDDKPLTYVTKLLGTSAKASYQKKLDIFTDIEGKQLRSMLYNLEPSENVFKLLKLDRSENPLTSPELGVWINYAFRLKSHARGNPSVTQTSLIENLVKHYDDEALVRFINAAKKTSNPKIKAKYVEAELLMKWAIDNKPLTYVTKMIGTSAKTSYQKNLEMLKGVENKHLRSMLYKQESPANVFKFLKLDSAKNPFTSPQLNDWVNYVAAFKDRTKGNPLAPHTSMIDILTKHNDEKALSTMIKAAKESDESKMIASVNVVEKELIEKWAAAREPLVSVSNRLGTTKEDKTRLQKIYTDKIDEIDTEYLRLDPFGQ
ncbi:hypothetical protein PHMEG_00034986 [Phytophthora megakarya]|uniref:RxLR effector PexRD54 WY domain-containing protein n=1 Tax=Phytophthora megakarya TaxID=4795 RepID=A0A225UQ76_9STRA|nr:hypothetical protein PHMEG_00034986 [Phytophthora megakarya]